MSRLMSTGRARCLRGGLLRTAVVLMLAAAGLLASVTPAFAHGEDKQPPNLRTRTVHFYDVQFSSPTMKVGDTFTMRGNMYLTQGWPDGVVNPDVTQLTVVAPGPTVLVKDRQIDGKFIAGSMRLEKGRNYPFAITVEARVPGKWHLHPMLTIEGAGGLIGPGQWIQVDGAPAGAPFTNNATLLDGEVVDLETFNTSTSILWHALYLIPAILLLVYWFGKPLMPRLVALVSGEKQPDELVTKRDIKVTVALSVVVLAITAVGFVYALFRWPDILPLQVPNTVAPAGQILTTTATGEVTGLAKFDEPRNTLTANIKIKNNGAGPIELTELETGNVRFTPVPDPAHPGIRMELNGPTTFAPGEEREVSVKLLAPDFAQHALIPRAEVSADVGGLLVFKDAAGAVSLAEVSMPVVTERVQAMGR